jgi:glutathione S-transferase
LTLTVYHLQNSRSQRVLWLLEELGVSYDVKRFERDPATLLAPDALRSIHPLGKAPIIKDGPVTLAESGAIVEYLVTTYGRGRLVPPPDSPDRWQYTYWLHYAEGSAMPPLLLRLVFSRLAGPQTPAFVRPVARGIARRVDAVFIEPQLTRHLTYLDSHLRDHAWFAGSEFTAADVQMSFPLEAARARGGLNQRYPRLQDFLERIHARPAYQRALARGGAYAYAAAAD